MSVSGIPRKVLRAKLKGTHEVTCITFFFLRTFLRPHNVSHRRKLPRPKGAYGSGRSLSRGPTRHPTEARLAHQAGRGGRGGEGKRAGEGRGGGQAGEEGRGGGQAGEEGTQGRRAGRGGGQAGQGRRAGREEGRRGGQGRRVEEEGRGGGQGGGQGRRAVEEGRGSHVLRRNPRFPPYWAGAALVAARRRKVARYPELTRGGPQRVVVLAAEVGGHWSDECQRFLRTLLRLRVQCAPPPLRASAAQGWARR